MSKNLYFKNLKYNPITLNILKKLYVINHKILWFIEKSDTIKKNQMILWFLIENERVPYNNNHKVIIKRAYKWIMKKIKRGILDRGSKRII